MKMEIENQSSMTANPEILLSLPGSIEFHPLTRISADFNEEGMAKVTDFSEGRVNREYSRQYANIYSIRLSSIRPILEKKITQEWPEIPLKKIAGLCETTTVQAFDAGTLSPRKSHSSPKKYSVSSPIKGNKSLSSRSDEVDEHVQRIALREDVTVAIIGTVFKQQPQKPSILNELVEEFQLTDRTTKDNYASDDDVVVLEDETTRVRLIPSSNCAFTIGGLVNGIVIGVKGRPTIDGRLDVEDIMFPTPSPSTWPATTFKDNAEMVFLSGLQFGQGIKNSIQIGMLFEHLQGLTGSVYEQYEIIRKRTKVFLLGNSIHIEDGSRRFHATASNARDLDKMLSVLAETMEIFVVSGKNDPIDALYPQKPMHSCLFPLSSEYSTFHLLSNPTRLKIPLDPVNSTLGAMDIILTDGEPVLDAMRFSNIQSGLEAGRAFLEWGHLCPTAPDTLPLHPGIDDDVFIIRNELPHFYFIGNQKRFETMEWKGSRIVSIPKFTDGGSAVVVTSNFEPRLLQFNLTL